MSSAGLDERGDMPACSQCDGVSSQQLRRAGSRVGTPAQLRRARSSAISDGRGAACCPSRRWVARRKILKEASDGDA